MLHFTSRPQQLFIDLLAILWPPFDPVTIYRLLGRSNWHLASISTTLRTTGLNKALLNRFCNSVILGTIQNYFIAYVW